MSDVVAVWDSVELGEEEQRGGHVAVHLRSGPAVTVSFSVPLPCTTELSSRVYIIHLVATRKEIYFQHFSWP